MIGDLLSVRIPPTTTWVWLLDQHRATKKKVMLKGTVEFDSSSCVSKRPSRLNPSIKTQF
jgi:hypothetical protein